MLTPEKYNELLMIKECPICMEELNNPMSLICHVTHRFCRKCITDYANSLDEPRCPMCRAEIFF